MAYGAHGDERTVAGAAFAWHAIARVRRCVTVTVYGRLALHCSGCTRKLTVTACHGGVVVQRCSSGGSSSRRRRHQQKQRVQEGPQPNGTEI